MVDRPKYPIRDMINELETTPGYTAIEKEIDCFELPDGRHVQLTAKLETDETLWIMAARLVTKK